MDNYYWITSILLISILTAISSWLTQRNNIYIKCVVPATVAALSFALLPCVDTIYEGLSEPQVNVSTHLEAKKSQIVIDIKVAKNPVKSATLDFSFHGIINRFKDVYESVEVVPKRIGENNIDDENRFKLEMGRINPPANLKYIIHYDPQPGYPIPTADRYEFSYNWEYRGRTKNKSLWQWSFLNKKASPPPVIHGEPVDLNAELSDKAIEFEMKRWYKNNIRERRLN